MESQVNKVLPAFLSECFHCGIYTQATDLIFIFEDILSLSQTDELPRLTKAAKILERMVNQNTFDYIAQGRTNKIRLLLRSFHSL